MSTDRDTTRTVRSWLEEGVTALPDRVLDAVLDRVPATPQRRSWWPAWRFAQMNTVRIAVAAAAVVVVAVLGYNMLPGRGGIGGPVTPPPTTVPTPTTAPSPTTRPLASPGPLPLDITPLGAGTYSLASFPVGVTVDVPAGWFSCIISPDEQGVCDRNPEAEESLGISFSIVTNVVADPCAASGQLLDPPVGPSVADLASAISGLKDFTATTPKDITVDGFAGKEFSVRAPVPPGGCFLRTWATANRTNGVGGGEVNLLRILDVNGTRVVIAGASNPALATPARAAAVQQVMDSIHFGP
jgi:hypothetical protein